MPITQAMPSEGMPSAADLLAEAERLFECGRVDEARQGFESLLSSADGDPWLEAEVLGDLAVMATYAGERAQAVDLASQALERCPDHLPALEVLAYCEPARGLRAGPADATNRPKRLLYNVNHRTLGQAEVPIFRELGYEVFIPKVVPGDDPEFRSHELTYEHDASLTCSAATLAVLNHHDFYRAAAWTPTVKMIVNREFDVVVVALSAYLTPLAEAVTNFAGLVVARAFGREHPYRYTDHFTEQSRLSLLSAMEDMGDRFVFGQGYDNLAEIENAPLRTRRHTITVPLPERIFEAGDTWTGDGTAAIFICPGILDHVYYRERYDEIKRDFGDLPHAIFGRQATPVADPDVLPYLTDAGLGELYAQAPVFVYPSREARHVHYSPIEAMVESPSPPAWRPAVGGSDQGIPGSDRRQALGRACGTAVGGRSRLPLRIVFAAS
ncbi:MAG TPA: hypothetical protein VG371_01770 [Solirubrobacteraceae bacterium]|nr:hypothetical protein [Solirubrobacteraceae bacterium]